MNNAALITGASSGIGRDFARIHASRGGDLVIVARSEGALDELSAELEEMHGVQVLCIAADLTDDGAPRRIFEEVQGQNIEIDILINNAGFGGHGKFHERRWEDDRAMIELNVRALCEMTHRFGQPMVPRRRGRILNVASMAAFVPGPLQAVYYATKAFVVSFSQAIAEELAESNVTVTALCPGAVETNFAKRANLEDLPVFQTAAPSMKVAKAGYEGMLSGKLVVTNDWKLTLVKDWVLPFVPQRMLLRISRRSMEKD